MSIASRRYAPVLPPGPEPEPEPETADELLARRAAQVQCDNREAHRGTWMLGKVQPWCGACRLRDSVYAKGFATESDVKSWVVGVDREALEVLLHQTGELVAKPLTYTYHPPEIEPLDDLDKMRSTEPG